MFQYFLLIYSKYRFDTLNYITIYIEHNYYKQVNMIVIVYFLHTLADTIIHYATGNHPRLSNNTNINIWITKAICKTRNTDLHYGMLLPYNKQNTGDQKGSRDINGLEMWPYRRLIESVCLKCEPFKQNMKYAKNN